MAVKKPSKEVQIVRMEQGRATYCVLGMAPLILHKMAAKAQHELLFPSGRKTAAQKKNNIKHDPIAEFRTSVHVMPDDDGTAVTRLALPSTTFKNALRNAAIDVEGATKAAIGRLTYVEGEFVPVWGTPKLRMDVVRMSDMNKTPDVRTRACLEEWCSIFTVSFSKPAITPTDLGNLLAAAGHSQGVGEWRPQKGSGSFGRFDVVEEKNETVKRLMAYAGKEAQDDALKHPVPYNGDSAELLSWFVDEAAARGVEVTS